MKIVLGADPEIFLQKNGIPHSAHGLIPGTKKEPFKVDKGAVQIDGTATEFNIEPAMNAAEFVHNTQTVMKCLEAMIPPEYRLHIAASVRYAQDHFDMLPVEAKELGCDPDFNAYTKKANPRPNNKTTLRTAAGHVHIGWRKRIRDVHEPAHFSKGCILVKQLDWFLGVPSLFLDPDKERRSMYGAAGAFRPKPYGCEYRVLSNFWVKSPAHMEWVYNQTLLAVKELLAGNEMEKLSPKLAQQAIALNDKDRIKHYFPDAWAKINTFEHLL